MATFDLQGALKEGHSMSEVADFLGQQNKFNVAAARKEGYSDQEIVAQLMKGGGPASTSPAPGSQPDTQNPIPENVSDFPLSEQQQTFAPQINSAIKRGAIGAANAFSQGTTGKDAYNQPPGGGGVAGTIGGLMSPTAGSVGGIPQGVMGSTLTKLANAPAGATVGMATRSPAMQYIEKASSYLPGGEFLSRAISRVNDTIGGQIRNIVDNLRGGYTANEQSAGNMLSKSVGDATQTIQDAAGAQFDKVMDLLPKGSRINMPATLAILRRINLPEGMEGSAGALINKRLMAFKQGLEDDLAGKPSTILGPDGKPMPPTGQGSALLQSVRDIKTILGDSINWDESLGALKAPFKLIYGAMLQDISSGATKINPALGQAITDANKSYTVAQARIQALQNVISKGGGSEGIFNNLMAGTKQGDENLRRVLVALGPQDRNMLAATQLRRMGLATPGAQGAAGEAFSGDTFLSNWNKMSANSKEALFGRLPGNYSASLDQIVKNIEAIKAYGRVLGNPPGTARAGAYLGSGGFILNSVIHGNWRELGGILGAGALNGGLGAIMTNPRAVAWLARKTTPALYLAGRATQVGSQISGGTSTAQQPSQSPTTQ